MRNIKRLDPDKCAIVIVDLQKGYCDLESDCARLLGWDVSEADRVAERHVPFLNEARKIYRPEQIVWLHMEEHPDTNLPNVHYGPDPYNDIFVTLCVRGTEGHKFHRAEPQDGEPDFLKFHPSGFSNKDLDAYFKSKGITQLAFTGGISSRCVNATLITASALGYECILLEDLVCYPGHLTEEDRHHRAVTTLFYALALTSGDFLAASRAAPGSHTGAEA